jgi:hypothetical protein
MLEVHDTDKQAVFTGETNLGHPESGKIPRIFPYQREFAGRRVRRRLHHRHFVYLSFYFALLDRETPTSGREIADSSSLRESLDEVRPCRMQQFTVGARAEVQFQADGTAYFVGE